MDQINVDVVVSNGTNVEVNSPSTSVDALINLPPPLSPTITSPTYDTQACVVLPQGPIGPVGPSGAIGPSGIPNTGELDLRYVNLTGNQTISGNKTFATGVSISGNLQVSETGIFNALDLSNISEFNFSGTDINLINGNVYISGGTAYISGNPVLTAVDLSPYALSVYTTGNQTISGNKIFANSGYFINIHPTGNVGIVNFYEKNISYSGDPISINFTTGVYFNDLYKPGIAANLIRRTGNIYEQISPSFSYTFSPTITQFISGLSQNTTIRKITASNSNFYILYNSGSSTGLVTGRSESFGVLGPAAYTRSLSGVKDLQNGISGSIGFVFDSGSFTGNATFATTGFAITNVNNVYAGSNNYFLTRSTPPYLTGLGDNRFGKTFNTTLNTSLTAPWFYTGSSSFGSLVNPNGHQVLDISAGKSHTLGIFLNIFGGSPNGILNSRYAVGWGANDFGQTSLAPGLGFINTGVLKVAAGDTYSLVVKNPNKSLYFWGNYVGFQGTFNSASSLLIGTGAEDITNNLILLNNGRLIEIGDALRRGLTAQPSSYAYFPSKFETYFSGSSFDRNNFFNIDLSEQQLSLRRTPNSTTFTAFDKDLLTITGGNLKITSGNLNITAGGISGIDLNISKTGSMAVLAAISGTIENPILGIANTVSGLAGFARSKILGDDNNILLEKNTIIGNRNTEVGSRTFGSSDGDYIIGDRNLISGTDNISNFIIGCNNEVLGGSRDNSIFSSFVKVSGARFSSVIGRSLIGSCIENSSLSNIFGGTNNCIIKNQSSSLCELNSMTIIGGSGNLMTNFYRQPGGSPFPQTSSYSAIINGANNVTSGSFDLVLGGFGNSTDQDFNTIASSALSKIFLVGGCCTNMISNNLIANSCNSNIYGCQIIFLSTLRCGTTCFSQIIGGSNNNIAFGKFSTIIGGFGNIITGDYSKIIGGLNNSINLYTGGEGGVGDYSFIIGSKNSRINQPSSIILGGANALIIDSGHSGSMILSDASNRTKRSFARNGLTIDFDSGVYFSDKKIFGFVPEMTEIKSNFLISGNLNSDIIIADSPSQITGILVSGNPTGFNASIIQRGAGQIQITGSGVGIIINSYNNQYRTAGQFASVSLLHTGNNIYIMYGNTAL